MQCFQRSSLVAAATFIALIGSSLSGGLGSIAHAQQSPPADPAFDAGGGALVLTALSLLGAVGTSSRPPSRDQAWDRGLFGPLDKGSRGTFSRSAMIMSDGLVGLSIVSPLVINFSDGFDRPAWERSLILGESVAVNLLASSIVKQLANRRRPYTYSDDPEARAHAKKRDANASFYSGILRLRLPRR